MDCLFNQLIYGAVRFLYLSTDLCVNLFIFSQIGSWACSSDVCITTYSWLILKALDNHRRNLTQLLLLVFYYDQWWLVEWNRCLSFYFQAGERNFLRSLFDWRSAASGHLQLLYTIVVFSLYLFISVKSDLLPAPVSTSLRFDIGSAHGSAYANVICTILGCMVCGEICCE
jgi:hypothetical protein